METSSSTAIRDRAARGGDRIVLVALDDHRAAWFQMLVPFLVSLRETDYSGEIGVLDYGLSADKVAVLRRQGVLVLEPLRQAGLATDRWLTAAQFVREHPECQRAAVYDADIWFASKRLSLFDDVAADGMLHVAPDYVACDFVFAPVPDEPGSEAVRESLQSALASLGPLQAGLVAGDRTAWLRFGAFLKESIEGVPRLRNVYGIDTTLLVQYAGLGGVRLVSKRHNAVPHWGLRRTHFPRAGFTVDGEEVEAVHMIGELRHHDCWAFQRLHQDAHLRGAESFSFEPVNRSTPIEPPPHSGAISVGKATLKVVSGSTSGDCRLLDGEEAVLLAGRRAAAVFACRGNSEIRLEAVQGGQFELLPCTLGPLVRPDAIDVELNGQPHVVPPNIATFVTVGAGATLVLRTRAADAFEALLLFVLR
jgi:hypothetical protein